MEPYRRYYKIVGKGNSGEQKCSGSIVETYRIDNITEDVEVSSIKITLSEMLSETFEFVSKKQIDERTIQYGDIIKQKCNVGKNVYFFVFPPLYQGQGRTVYKVVDDDSMNDLNDRLRYGNMYDIHKKAMEAIRSNKR